MLKLMGSQTLHLAARGRPDYRQLHRSHRQTGVFLQSTAPSSSLPFYSMKDLYLLAPSSSRFEGLVTIGDPAQRCISATYKCSRATFLFDTLFRHKACGESIFRSLAIIRTSLH